MTTLNELEALAKAAEEPIALSMHDGHTQIDMDRATKLALFYDAVNPQTILQMIALIRQQHEALKTLSMKQARWTDDQIAALEAYEEFDS